MNRNTFVLFCVLLLHCIVGWCQNSTNASTETTSNSTVSGKCFKRDAAILKKDAFKLKLSNFKLENFILTQPVEVTTAVTTACPNLGANGTCCNTTGVEAVNLAIQNLLQTFDNITAAKAAQLDSMLSSLKQNTENITIRLSKAFPNETKAMSVIKTELEELHNILSTEGKNVIQSDTKCHQAYIKYIKGMVCFLCDPTWSQYYRQSSKGMRIVLATNTCSILTEGCFSMYNATQALQDAVETWASQFKKTLTCLYTQSNSKVCQQLIPTATQSSTVAQTNSTNPTKRDNDHKMSLPCKKYQDCSLHICQNLIKGMEMVSTIEPEDIEDEISYSMMNPVEEGERGRLKFREVVEKLGDELSSKLSTSFGQEGSVRQMTGAVQDFKRQTDSYYNDYISSGGFDATAIGTQSVLGESSLSSTSSSSTSSPSTSSPSTSSPSTSTSSNSSNIGIGLGIIIGTIIVLVALGALIAFIVIRKRRQYGKNIIQYNQPANPLYHSTSVSGSPSPRY